MKTSIVILCLLGDPVLPAVSYDRTGGFNVDMAEILKYWSSSSYSITVITNSSVYIPCTDEQLYENIQLHRVYLEHDILNDQQELAKRFPRVLQETIEFLDQHKIQPLFFHSYYWFSGLLALELSRKYNVKFLHSVVALAIDKKLTNADHFCPVQLEYENYFLPYASYIMAISNAEKKTLVKYYDCNEKKILVVGRSVDDAFLLQDHDAKGITNALLQDNDQKWNSYLKEQVVDTWLHRGAFTYFGRIKYEKGVGNIVEAWYQLYLIYKENIPPLWIVGGHPDSIHMLRKDFIYRYPEFTNLEKEMRICWWGYLTPSSINAILLKTNAVVTHSQYEAGGRVIIEALSAGKPVIATPTGFADDLVRDWKNGFLVPFGNINLLKRRMEHFIRQPLITLPLGECARSTFQKASENWHYYEKHRAVYQYLGNSCRKEPDIFQKEIDVLEQVPDFYRKKLLYAWPDAKEIEKRIAAWLREIWKLDKPVLTYQPDLSHHSFVWEFHTNGKEYYVKHLYTTLNTLLLWTDIDSMRDVCQASRAYDIAVNAGSALEINAQNQQLCSYITKKQQSVSKSCFLKDYEGILKTIYQFDTARSFEKIEPSIDTYTYAQLLEFAYNDLSCYSGLHRTFRETLEKEIEAWKISVSYGKEFFSHVIISAKGYQLLPSSSVCRAPLGIDAAIFLTEIRKEFKNTVNPQVFSKMLKDASGIFHLSTLSMYCLCLLIQLLIFKKQYLLYQILSAEEDIAFWHEVLLLLG